METSNKKNESQQSSLIPLTLTDNAVKKIKSMMLAEGKDGFALRVGVSPGGCAGLSYDLRFQNNPYENDFIFEQKGLKIFINPESLTFLKGIEIDYKETLKESGFQYRNPNAKSSCGCGTSFS